MFSRIVLCILCLGLCLYSYLDMQNEITELRIKIPDLMSEVRRIQEENTHYQYEIERFQSPENLMSLAKQSAFSHLQFPIDRDVLSMQQAELLPRDENLGKVSPTKRTITFATGAASP